MLQNIILLLGNHIVILYGLVCTFMHKYLPDQYRWFKVLFFSMTVLLMIMSCILSEVNQYSVCIVRTIWLHTISISYSVCMSQVILIATC